MENMENDPNRKHAKDESKGPNRKKGPELSNFSVTPEGKLHNDKQVDKEKAEKDFYLNSDERKQLMSEIFEDIKSGLPSDIDKDFKNEILNPGSLDIALNKEFGSTKKGTLKMKNRLANLNSDTEILEKKLIEYIDQLLAKRHSVSGENELHSDQEFNNTYNHMLEKYFQFATTLLLRTGQIKEYIEKKLKDQSEKKHYIKIEDDNLPEVLKQIAEEYSDITDLSLMPLNHRVDVKKALDNEEDFKNLLTSKEGTSNRLHYFQSIMRDLKEVSTNFSSGRSTFQEYKDNFVPSSNKESDEKLWLTIDGYLAEIEEKLGVLSKVINYIKELLKKSDTNEEFSVRKDAQELIDTVNAIFVERNSDKSYINELLNDYALYEKGELTSKEADNFDLTLEEQPALYLNKSQVTKGALNFITSLMKKGSDLLDHRLDNISPEKERKELKAEIRKINDILLSYKSKIEDLMSYYVDLFNRISKKVNLEKKLVHFSSQINLSAITSLELHEALKNFEEFERYYGKEIDNPSRRYIEDRNKIMRAILGDYAKLKSYLEEILTSIKASFNAFEPTGDDAFDETYKEKMKDNILVIEAYIENLETAKGIATNWKNNMEL